MSADTINALTTAALVLGVVAVVIAFAVPAGGSRTTRSAAWWQ